MIAARSRSLLGDARLAQAVPSALHLCDSGRIVGHRRKVGAMAGERIGGVERERRRDRGTRLVQSTKPRERGAQIKIWKRKISVGLDRPSGPRDRLLVKAEEVLRKPCVVHPDV